MKKRLALSSIVATIPMSFSLENGAARTPPMGWLSWEKFRCQTDCATHPHDCINMQLYMDMADQIETLGLRELGYLYVNVDDCWSAKERTASGDLMEDSTRFDMQALSDYIHAKKLLFGLYADIGTKTCAGYPGLKGHLEADTRKFLDWGIDFLKVDGCNENFGDMEADYSHLSDILRAAGRPIVYSCSWPAYLKDHGETPHVMGVLKDKCNMWRNYYDIDDTKASLKQIIDFFAKSDPNHVMVQTAGPGHWNDPDMLVVGNDGVTLSEQRAQFAFWAILAAPLIMSNDLRTISAESLTILKNKEVIDINQDPLGKQGYVIVNGPGTQRVWKRDLVPAKDGSQRVAVLFDDFNSDTGTATFTFSASQLGWTEGSFSVRDVHLHQDVLVNVDVGTHLIATVAKDSVEMFVFTHSSSPTLQQIQPHTP